MKNTATTPFLFRKTLEVEHTQSTLMLKTPRRNPVFPARHDLIVQVKNTATVVE